MDRKTLEEVLQGQSEALLGPGCHRSQRAIDLGGGTAQDEVADGSFGDLDVLVGAQDVDLVVGQHDSETVGG